jgi:hypothetical protein
MKIRTKDIFDKIGKGEAKTHLYIFEPLKRNEAHLALEV